MLASHTWISEEQETAWKKWKSPKHKPGTESQRDSAKKKNWKRIYMSLYPNAREIPDPCKSRTKHWQVDPTNSYG